MKYLIAGLGNIGDEYQNTRHNIGFNVLDAFAEASNFSFEPNRYAFTASTKFKGRTLVCIKPTTYMNLSGKAVRYYMETEKIPTDRILVITDDIALPFGKLRLKGKGSDGGHNGLKNIIELIKTQQFPRLRFGIGNEFSKGKQVNYVLGKWTPEEQKQLPERIDKCIEIIKSFSTIGLSRTMNLYNNK
jgi:PTH1 family peptidyl-tRNA hydrolase